MHRSQLLRTTLPFLLLAMLSCGGEPPLELKITLSDAALRSAQTTEVRVALLSGSHDCDLLRLSGSEVVVDKSITVGQSTGSTTLSNIREGVYTVHAWGYNAAKVPRIFGCNGTPVTIENGKKASVTLTLDPL